MRDFKPKDDWHVYELVWTPEYISFNVDLKEVRRILANEAAVKRSTRPQSVMMNFWTPTFEPWSTGLDPTNMPW